MPIPVSVTVNCKVFDALSAWKPSVTDPLFVNLMALSISCEIIRYSALLLVLMVKSSGSALSIISCSRPLFFSSASPMMVFKRLPTFTISSQTNFLLLLYCAISSNSLNMVVIMLLFSLILFTISVCSSGDISYSGLPMSCAYPVMILSGVRISWLTCSINAVFIRSDSVACSSATLSSRFFCSIVF